MLSGHSNQAERKHIVLKECHLHCLTSNRLIGHVRNIALIGDFETRQQETANVINETIPSQRKHWKICHIHLP